MRWQVVQLWSVKSKGREKQAGNNADEEATFNVYIVVTQNAMKGRLGQYVWQTPRTVLTR